MYKGNLDIELYGNLIITFLGIFAPLLTILMNISKEGIAILERTHGSTKKIIEEDIKASALKADTGKMKSYIKRMESKVRSHKHDLRLLKPKRQFLRTFCTLMVSFIFLEIYIATDTIQNEYFVKIQPLFLYLSIIVFAMALVIIWQILSTLITVREALKDKGYDEHTPSPVQTTPKHG